MPLNTHQDLPRRLGLLDATCIVVGTVIGAGIFMVPAIVARNVHSASGILLVWIVGGILSYFGALAYAELGAAYPATGGQYVFLREAYGPGMAFVCGWTLWLVVMSGNLAAVAVSFTIYLGYFLPLSALQMKAAAVTLIAILTYLNYRGVRLGATVQNTMTLLKLTGIAVLIGSAFLFRPNVTTDFLAPPTGLTLQGFGMALVASLVAYDGWSNLSFVNGEVVKPQRTLPRALAIGLGVAMAVYLLANIAYVRVLTPAGIAGAARVGSEVAQQTMGAAGAAFLSVTVLVSMLGACNGTVMTAPRLYFAQALDGLFFRRFAQVHPTHQTPSVSVVAQGIWGALLAATGSYELIINYAIFCAWAFYALVVIGLMILRRSQPDVPRPYRLWGYPVTPILFVGVAVLVLVNSIVTTPLPSFAGLGIILAGIPVYFYWRRRHGLKVAGIGNVVLITCLLTSVRAETGAAKNPLADQPAAISAGQKLFVAGCSACHGASGEGGRGPDLVRAWFVRKASDRRVFDTIRNGVAGTEMPPSRMSDESIWQIVAFLRSVSAPAYDLPVVGNVEAGRKVFFGKGGCAGCHSIAGKGGAIGPDLSDVGKANPMMKLRESVLEPNAFLVDGYRTVKVTTSDGLEIAGIAKDNTNYSIVVLDSTGELHTFMKKDLRSVAFRKSSLMPANFKKRLSTAEIDDLLAFLSRQASRPANRDKE